MNVFQWELSLILQVVTPNKTWQQEPLLSEHTGWMRYYHVHVDVKEGVDKGPFTWMPEATVTGCEWGIASSFMLLSRCDKFFSYNHILVFRRILHCACQMTTSNGLPTLVQILCQLVKHWIPNKIHKTPPRFPWCRPTELSLTFWWHFLMVSSSLMLIF